MPIVDDNLNIKENLPFNTKKVIFVMVSLLIIIIVLLVYSLKFKSDENVAQPVLPTDNETIKNVVNSSSGISPEFGSVDLPLVNQFKLKKDYQTNLAQIITNLEQEIELAGSMDQLDDQRIRIVKDAIMQEIVPQEYRIVHMSFILTLDKILRKDFATVDSDIIKIKREI